MNVWAKWFLIAMVIWFLSLVSFALIARILPGSPLVYVFGVIFSVSILAALVFLGLLFRGLFDEGN